MSATRDPRPGEVLMELLAVGGLDESPYVRAVFQDLGGWLDLYEQLTTLTPADLRLAMVSLLLVFADPEADDIPEVLRMKADWVEGSPVGRGPCADPAGVAGALRRVASHLEQPIAGPDPLDRLLGGERR